MSPHKNICADSATFPTQTHAAMMVIGVDETATSADTAREGEGLAKSSEEDHTEQMRRYCCLPPSWESCQGSTSTRAPLRPHQGPHLI